MLFLLRLQSLLLFHHLIFSTIPRENVFEMLSLVLLTHSYLMSACLLACLYLPACLPGYVYGLLTTVLVVVIAVFENVN